MNKKGLCLLTGCGFAAGLAVSGIVKAVKVSGYFKKTDSERRFERLLKRTEMREYLELTRKHNEQEILIPYILKKRRAGLNDKEIEKGYNDMIIYGSMEGAEHLFNAFAEVGLNEADYPYYTVRIAKMIFPDIKDYLHQDS